MNDGREFRNVVKLEKKVQKKYKSRIDAAGKIRAGYFVRAFGKRGLDELLRENGAFKFLVARNYQANSGSLFKIAVRVGSPVNLWLGLRRAKGGKIFKTIKANPKVRICKER